MKRYQSIAAVFILIFLLLLPGIGLAIQKKHNRSGLRTHSSPAGMKDLSAALGRLLNDTLFDGGFIGCRIVNAGTGALLFDMNGNKQFHPASTLKLFTAATACALLPSDFRFSTALGSSAPPEDGVLQGNLTVTGGGDPLAVSADLYTLASALIHAGIRSIRGDIVGDISLFDSLAWGHGWMWDDEPDPDEAFISPLTVDHNAIRVIEIGRASCRERVFGFV
jgi:serine-type D-Ala-D-Ala carboxypeptidase/endopeptidase (penicillin-binding protein 4)